MPKGISIHIGLNNVDPQQYEGWDGSLVACEADASAMRQIAESRGYTSQVLLTQQATSSAVLGALRSAANDLRSGDILLLTYSGHGGQIPDSNGDESDGMDETWVLYDRMLIDDELYQEWSRFQPGVRIVLVSDSCHSGTVARMRIINEIRNHAGLGEFLGIGSSVRAKVIPRLQALKTFVAHEQQYKALQKGLPREAKDSIGASVILLSGCQDNQVAMDGNDNGLFTAALLAVWNDGKFTGDYRRFHQQIHDAMPMTQSPNFYEVGAVSREFESQAPFSITGETRARKSPASDEARRADASPRI